MGRGRGQSVQAGNSGAQGRVYAVTPQTEVADQLVIQGTFLLFRLWARVLFCKTRQISNFWKKGKIVISVKNPKFIL